jgi:hypothetical protein
LKIKNEDYSDMTKNALYASEIWTRARHFTALGGSTNQGAETCKGKHVNHIEVTTNLNNND